MTGAPVVVTGAAGFVGRAVTAALLRTDRPVRRALRTPSGDAPQAGVTDYVVGDLGADARWEGVLDGADSVVHLAARVHVLDDRAADPLAAYRRVNVAGTRRLAEAAARAGVRRMVFLSTVKVHGERTAGRPFTEADQPAPEDPYGRSKAEAEAALAAVAAATGLEVVVLRPPLVYGPGVGANFLALVRAVDRGLPLPFASAANRRSLVYVENLADAVVRCIDSGAAAGGTFLVDDGQPRSTADLVRAIAAALGRPARLWPCPVRLMRCAARLVGRGAMAERLLGDLEVDSRSLRTRLAWTPPVRFEDGVAATVRWYRAHALVRR
jgi:nucleoside-diphosphate-sugar epimerase